MLVLGTAGMALGALLGEVSGSIACGGLLLIGGFMSLCEKSEIVIHEAPASAPFGFGSLHDPMKGDED